VPIGSDESQFKYSRCSCQKSVGRISVRQGQSETSAHNFIGQWGFAELLGGALDPCEGVRYTDTTLLHKRQSLPDADRRQPEFVAASGQRLSDTRSQSPGIEFAPDPYVRIQQQVQSR